MPHSSPWSKLRQSWSQIDLPGYREFTGTYREFPTNALPPISIPLDDNCAWLMQYGTEQDRGLDQYKRDLQPAAVLQLAARAGIELPVSFRHFMSDPRIQKRVRSCTDCYLDPGQRIVETVGSIPGHLIHFLSDSQSCVHWYLHVIADGRAAVLESEYLYCYPIKNPEWLDYHSCGLDKIDLQELGFACCATSFPEFLYRFWIENEIWFALQGDKAGRTLTLLERDYVGYYPSGK
jgi:hypothetical protein